MVQTPRRLCLTFLKPKFKQVAQYIGETCRYLLAAPPRPEDKTHKVRLMFGNGLRPQIWEEFINRFNIPQVSEFYGATEGNANISKIINYYVKGTPFYLYSFLSTFS